MPSLKDHALSSAMGWRGSPALFAATAAMLAGEQTENAETLEALKESAVTQTVVQAGSFGEAFAKLQARPRKFIAGRSVEKAIRKHQPFGSWIAIVVKDGLRYALHATKGWRVIGKEHA